MRKSKEYKNHLKWLKEKTFDDFRYSDGFTDGYEDCFEEHKHFLEWQKPEDVELEDGELYIIKSKKEKYVFIGTYDKADKAFTSFDLMYSYDIKDVLIKQVEV